MKKQRQLYREKIYKCGSYTEVNIYPVFAMQHGRGRKRKPTGPAQQALNGRNAKQRFIRLVNTNFGPGDLRLDLTYRPGEVPEDPAAAQRQVQNFIRRLKNYRRKQDLPELKYVYVTEIGEKTGRVHHHIILNGGVDVGELQRIWGKGYTTVKPLDMDPQTGAAALAAYMVKSPILYKRWNASKNLKQPEEITRDGRISKARAQEWSAAGIDGRATLEAWYGQNVADVRPFYNDVNGGVYLVINLYEKVNRRRPHEKQDHAQSRRRM